MIEKMQPADLPAILNIWLTANQAAHAFIPASYWQTNLPAVEKMLPQAEVYLIKVAGQPAAFVGLEENYIAGIFVSIASQRQGLGAALINFLQGQRKELSLQVYQKNTAAIAFYQHHGFDLRESTLDSATGEVEYLMTWKKAKGS